MVRRYRIAFAVAMFGAVVAGAHLVLGAAGVMTAAQWQSGALIGAVLAAVGGGRLAIARHQG